MENGSIDRSRIVRNMNKISELTHILITRYNGVYGADEMTLKTVEELEEDANLLKEKLSKLNISPDELEIYYQQVDEIKDFYIGMLNNSIKR